MKSIRELAIGIVAFAAALAITDAAGVLLIGIPRADAWAVAKLFGLAGGAAALAAFVLMRPAVLGRIGGIRAQLAGAGLVASLLLLAMMMAAARAMFLSAHDLAVLLTMLLFAALLAVGFSLLWAAPLAGRIERVRRATARLASGDRGLAVAIEGHDEITALAADFNRMAAELQRVAIHEQQIEQARRDLIAAVSHDLRTPLAAVQALIEAVADGVAGDPETEARYLAAAQQEIVHLGQLVDDLFELAQIDSGVLRLTLERTSLSDLISDTIAGFQARAERQGVRLIGEIDGEVDQVLISPPKMQRVLGNLVDNALRYTPTDGTIVLRAARCESMVRVEVADSGRGIAPADLPRVFERSFRGERSRTRRSSDGPDAADAIGAGLGLTIARGLIEAQGGSIKVESELGLGTRFCFTVRRA